ncbi:MAG: glycosyltransferase family 4 protein [Bdellovibrionales bacterium]|nr:glycosyltransferase family 4 protein [Bdellovibrionales bacterium]
MKILIEITEAVRSNRGWGRYAGELVEALVKLDRENQYTFFYHSVESLTSSEREWRDRLSAPNVTFFPIEICRERYDALEEDRRASFLDDQFPDADLYHAVTEFPFHVTRIPKITTIHEISPLLFHDHFSDRWLSYFLRYIREALATSAKVITVSENTRNELIEWVGASPDLMKPISNGVSELFFSKPVPVAKQGSALDLLYVGPVSDPLKNFEVLWKAFCSSPSGTTLHVIASDTNYDRFIKERQVSIDRAKSLRISSHVTDEQLLDFYRQASVLVFPALHEGFGLPVLEAMAVGLPVVCNGQSGLREVADGVNFPFGSNSPEQLWQAVCSAADAPLSQREWGRKKASGRTWERAAEQYLEVYEHVVR